jgi:large subunit ribosomal protein L5
MNATAPPARLKTRYLEEIRPALIGRFGYSSVMQAPKIEKITVNMGVGDAKQDSKVLKAAVEQLATIAGQQPSVRRSRKSIAAFKLREGMPVGVSVTLRSERGYEFLDRLVSIAIPRIRDFRGLNPRSFDGRGNYSLGVREQIIFPEIDYDAIDQVRGLDITITTSAATDVEAFALLSAMGMPFAAQGRPAGFDLPGEETVDEVPKEPEAAAPVEAAEAEAVAEDEAAVEAEAVAEDEAAVEAEAVAEAGVVAEAEIAAPVQSEDAPEAETEAEAVAEDEAAVEAEAAAEAGVVAETAPAAVEDAAPAEPEAATANEAAIEQPADAAPEAAASEDAVEKPADAAPAEAEEPGEKTAAKAKAAKPKAAKPKAAKAKAAKPKAAKPKAAKTPAKPRKAKPKAKAEDASAEKESAD